MKMSEYEKCPPDSEMVEWTWRRRAEAAEAEVERLAETVERVRVLAQNALLANDAGMGYPVVAADDILHALDGAA